MGSYDIIQSLFGVLHFVALGTGTGILEKHEAGVFQKGSL